MRQFFSMFISMCLVVLVTPGCESMPTSGTAADDTTGDDTTGDDTTRDETSCVVVGCDDGDPCNHDTCNRETGICSYSIATAVSPACQSDAECDDGNACTADACVAVPGDGECVLDWSSCEQTPIEGCIPDCNAVGCDDGNHCTDDLCQQNGTCSNTLVFGCLQHCATIQANDVVEAVYGLSPDEFVVVRGAGSSHRETTCDDGGCVCESLPAVRGQGEQLALTPPPQTDDQVAVSWQCSENRCTADGLAADCVPFAVGREYLVWGSLLGAEHNTQGNTAKSAFNSPPGGHEEAPQPRAAFGIAVQDYCMAMTASGLAGVYRGVVDGDEPQVQFIVDASIAYDGAAWSVSVLVCDETACDLEWHQAQIEVGANSIRVVIDLHWGNTVSMTLYPNRNTLAGQIESTTVFDGHAFVLSRVN